MCYGRMYYSDIYILHGVQRRGLERCVEVPSELVLSCHAHNVMPLSGMRSKDVGTPRIMESNRSLRDTSRFQGGNVVYS